METAVDIAGIEISRVHANGIGMQVATMGAGPPVLLLHGWPFTWFVWRRLMPALAASGYRALAPDLRGIGGTDCPTDGYDLHTLADDAAGLLQALDAEHAAVVGFDLGAAPAWMLAMRHPGAVRRLVLMEALLGSLPGAEKFLAHGAPWWFGFHAAPGLAETVLAGNEGPYLDWFFTNHTAGRSGIDPRARDFFVQAYSGRDALRGGFEHYRAFPVHAAQIAAAVKERRLTVPTMALGGGVVGDALYKQLAPISDQLTGHIIPDCGHIIPEEQPEALAAAVLSFIT